MCAHLFQIALLLFGIVFSVSGAAEAEMRPASSLEFETGSDLFQDPDAAKRTLAQLMFNSETQTLERRVYELVAPRLTGALDAVWEPTATNLDAGPISGSGRIIWRRAGTAPYSHTAIVAVFEGNFVDGRGEGNGRFWHRDGLVYEGGWRDGRFDGQGQIQLPGGRHYEGGGLRLASTREQVDMWTRRARCSAVSSRTGNYMARFLSHHLAYLPIVPNSRKEVRSLAPK